LMSYLELEKSFGEYVGTNTAVAVNTGTAALHVAIEALELPPGSKILVPEFTMYASALAVHYARMIPVFVDCDDDLLIDLEIIEDLIDDNTKALVVTHIYGRVVDMTRVMQIAKKYNLRIIEDACEAHGAKWGDKYVGTFDIGCFSFYRNKIVHAEEGGMVVSDDTEYMDIVRDMKCMSFGEEHNYYHKRIGFNYRITDAQSAEVLKSLKIIGDNIAKRERIKNIFNDNLAESFKMPDNRAVVWVYDMIHPQADQIVKRLKKDGVEARHSFKPMSMMPLFGGGTMSQSYKETLAYKKSQEVFYIQIDPKWTDDKISQVIKSINSVI
jgi:perosamine synthetase